MRQPHQRQRNEQVQLKRRHGQRHRVAQLAKQADRRLLQAAVVVAADAAGEFVVVDDAFRARPTDRREQQLLLLLHAVVQLVLVRFVGG